jgi:hypothetical protein
MNQKIELVSGGRKVDGVFQANPAKQGQTQPSSALKNLSIGMVAKPPKPITPNDLTGETSAMNITPATPTTGAAGLQGQIDASVAQLQANAQASQQATKQAKDPLIEAMQNMDGETALTDTAYAETVDPVQSELNDINSQIMAEQQGLRRRLETLDKNQGGLFGGALEAEKRRVENESLSKQADLSVIQMAVQGRYDSAKAIADRAVAVKMEQQKQNLQMLQFNYLENKEQFTKDEQRAFEAAQTERERSLKAEETRLKEISDFSLMALQAGAPPSLVTQMRQAKSLTEAIGMGGGYLMPKPTERLRQTSVQEINGKKVLIDTQTGDIIKEFSVDTPITAIQAAQDISYINTVDSLKTHKGMSKAVGANKLARWTPLTADVATGEVSEFIASVDQLTKGLTLDQLISAKEQGATFGALSIPELSLIAESATKINSWRRTDGSGEGAPTTHYETSEKKFQKELDTISNFRKLDAVLKGTDPAAVGVVVNDDGTYWAENSDGSITQLR